MSWLVEPWWTLCAASASFAATSAVSRMDERDDRVGGAARLDGQFGQVEVFGARGGGDGAGGGLGYGSEPGLDPGQGRLGVEHGLEAGGVGGGRLGGGAYRTGENSPVSGLI